MPSVKQLKIDDTVYEIKDYEARYHVNSLQGSVDFLGDRASTIVSESAARTTALQSEAFKDPFYCVRSGNTCILRFSSRMTAGGHQVIAHVPSDLAANVIQYGTVMVAGQPKVVKIDGNEISFNAPVTTSDNDYVLGQLMFFTAHNFMQNIQ